MEKKSHHISHKTEKSKKSKLIIYGSYIVLALLIVTFIGVPIIGGQFSETGYNSFGKYGFQEIKYSEDNIFGRNVQELNDYYQQYAPQFRNNQIVWKQGFDRTVLIYALIDKARKNRTQVSEEELKTIIRNNPSFAGADGEFDPLLFNSMESEVKAGIVEEIRERTLAQKVQNYVLDNVFISDQEKNFYKTLNDTQKSFRYVKLDKNKISNTQVIIDYGNANSELFKKIHYKSITLETKEEAERVRNAIINGEETFNDSISFSIDSAKENLENPGDRGTSYAYEIKNNDGDDVLAVLSPLQETDDISEVVETLTGKYAFYQLSEDVIIPDFNNADEDLLSSVENYLASYDSGVLEDEAKKEAEAFVSRVKEEGFITSASNNGLEIEIIPFAPLNVDNISLLDKIENENDTSIRNVVSSIDILSDIYQLENIDDVTEPIIVDGYFYVFQLTGTRSPSEDTNPYDKDFQTRIVDFIADSNLSSIQKAVVDESKLTDNFATAYSRLYQ